ncbi:MAG: metallophosphoesterase family protein [Kiloniellales bacterium]|nr:metallophosphoesterase family protein [Kiloniellales bacterium]
MTVTAASQPRSGARRAARTPDGSRIYAIGDIHGRSDLLRALHQKILADADASRATRRLVVYLGDYIDRGSDSRGVIDLLIEGPPPGFAAVYLIGNHEEFLLRSLEDESAIRPWLMNGGQETCLSYGIDLRWGRLQEQLTAEIPAAHRSFFERLSYSHSEGDYFFAHAGIRPGVPLDEQQPQDLLWIREPFLSSEADHGKVVVHGHTPTGAPVLRHNRIGVDTGACYGGALTALALEEDRRAVLQV